MSADAGDGAGALRAVVDREDCFGFGFCVGTLPAVFAIDETGHAVALDVDADAGRLAQAVDDCPRGAISLIRRVAGAGASGGDA
jgi:ferredoxin